ncbi:DUF982 domain-containing protein [Mesorhizobium sp. ES1-4]|uniref:DUF982 domain-containing protein n=1 Tax=Mesorhizobium sp. ES1-4 TaxID=2876627 RepID=UPI001CCF6501|nr:DUF982 domain-containing protein [Mesorhizobium sp. ES1-4]MBZ9798648.1 DUF982 domain-containing protein [Mesorhizobium sp. ES1-4]
MYEAWFSKPVSVTTGIGGDIRNLLNAQQATDLLGAIGAMQEVKKHRSALRACRQDITGGVSADVAREVFVEAAREAHILVE